MNIKVRPGSKGITAGICNKLENAAGIHKYFKALQRFTSVDSEAKSFNEILYSRGTVTSLRVMLGYCSQDLPVCFSAH